MFCSLLTKVKCRSAKNSCLPVVPWLTLTRIRLLAWVVIIPNKIYRYNLFFMFPQKIFLEGPKRPVTHFLFIIRMVKSVDVSDDARLFFSETQLALWNWWRRIIDLICTKVGISQQTGNYSCILQDDWFTLRCQLWRNITSCHPKHMFLSENTRIGWKGKLLLIAYSCETSFSWATGTMNLQNDHICLLYTSRCV